MSDCEARARTNPHCKRVGGWCYERACVTQDLPTPGHPNSYAVWVYFSKVYHELCARYLPPKNRKSNFWVCTFRGGPPLSRRGHRATRAMPPGLRHPKSSRVLLEHAIHAWSMQSMPGACNLCLEHDIRASQPTLEEHAIHARSMKSMPGACNPWLEHEIHAWSMKSMPGA